MRRNSYILLFALAALSAAGAVPTNEVWALKPLTRPAVPEISDARFVVRNPVDAFVVAKLRGNNLPQSPEADRRTLVRRLYFDLIGLPPTPAEIEAFVADADARAYEKLVDRLLDSPRHGERWARHWLDVVHYGDTHGYDKDKPRPNAWPYRDYVIRSFNADKPWARFVQEQVAGDVLFPGTRDGVEALGFIAAGPWDLISHEEVPESKTDGKIARHLDRDDMVVNTIQSFNSLTIQCAQCHDHKFDPISQEDYYSLQSVFAALDRADKKYFADAEMTERFNALERSSRELAERQRALDEKIKKMGGAELEGVEKEIAAASGKGNARAEFGFHSAIAAEQGAVKWVQVDLSAATVLDRIVATPCYDDFNNIGAGFGFPPRFKIEACDDPEFRTGVIILADRTGADVKNPGTAPLSFAAAGAVARHVRVTAVKLAPRKSDFIFALAELQVFDSTGRNAARGASVSALDSIEAPPRWRKANLVDSFAPASDDSEAIVALRAKRDAIIGRAVDAATRNELADVKRRLANARAELAKIPKPDVVYAGTVHSGTGNFRGTGADGGKPRPVFVLDRGNVLKPGREAVPGALSAVKALPARFGLPAGADEGARRAALAKWLTDADNPLTWRSVVNRVWHHHFGRGIVETPNDFGINGARPTHPELLDWLAAEFRDGGGSLKKLHRLIVTSATYRQRSDGTAGGAVDSGNRLLWRMNRAKLDAEQVRDAVLSASGKLDLKMGGPGFQDFVVERPEHSPHYGYHLHDPDDPMTHRRSVYRFLVRSQLQPLMTALDCADPSMQVARRNESVSPLQALALLNNGVVVTMARHFAAKLDAGGGTPAEKITRGFTEAVGRAPAAAEVSELADYAQQFGLPNACRAIFNLNEFHFVD